MKINFYINYQKEWRKSKSYLDQFWCLHYNPYFRKHNNSFNFNIKFSRKSQKYIIGAICDGHYPVYAFELLHVPQIASQINNVDRNISSLFQQVLEALEPKAILSTYLLVYMPMDIKVYTYTSL